MNNSLNLSIRQQQTLKMSPQMIQSISLMSLSAHELIDRIYEEVERNPALEIVKEASLQKPVNVKKNSSTSSASDSDAYQAFLESIPSRSVSLKDYLLSQLHVQNLSQHEIDIGEKIINNLDEYGYHCVPLKELFPSIPEDAFQKVLVRIQHFDPAGIACSGLQESLLLQALSKTDSPLLAVQILSLSPDTFEDIFSKPRPSLMLKKLQETKLPEFTSTSQEDLEEALTFIKSLDPFPAHQFSSSSSSNYIIPDIRIRKATDEEKEETGQEFVIELLNSVFPEVAVSSEFEKMAQAKKDKNSTSFTADKEVKKFAAEAVKDAQWFLRSIHQRNVTLLKTVQSILRSQKAFFNKGSRYLSPLRMKDVADEIGVHEATVSRIASSKYLQCEWGIFEIRYFFTTAVASTSASDGSSEIKDHSKESVKEELRLLIEKEGSLSDQKLSDLLAQKGIKIARRTVAKYRTELHITSSFDRK